MNVRKLISFITLICFSVCIQARVIFVSQNSTGDGSSWDNALNSISAALALAQHGDDIYVGAGIYSEVWGKPKPGVSILGGFNGAESSADEREMISVLPFDFKNETIITVLNSSVINASTSLDDSDNVIIDGFTFKNCINNNSIMILRGGIHLKNCRFIDNTTTLAATPPGTNNLVLFNMTALSGASQLNSSIVNCLFEGNKNEQNQNILGIRADVENSFVIVDNCIFRNNITDLESGSTNANILLAAGNNGFTSIRNCQLYNNSSKQAALSAAANAEIVNCLIFNNTCGTNHVLLAGKMYNSAVLNNSSRFCFNSNTAGVYNSVIAGNKTAGIAVNNTNYTTFELKNSAIDKAAPSVGIYDELIILDNITEAGFITPTTFSGIAANSSQETQILQSDWNVHHSSPLVNSGKADYFISSRYGNDNNKDITGNQVRYYHAYTDLNAFEAVKLSLNIIIGEGGELSHNQTGHYMEGQNLNLSVIPLAGYRVKEWRNQDNEIIGNTASINYLMPDCPQVLTVSFEKTDTQYTLNVIAGDGGTVTDVSGQYYSDQIISLKAFPSIGFKFKNWTDTDGNILSVSSDFNFTMPDKDIIVTANFERKNDDAANAHQFDFEGTEVNAQWNAEDGVISISDDRSQTGTQSLCWVTLPQERNVLRIDLVNSYLTASLTTCYFNIYNTDALRDGTLEINFYNASGTKVRTATQSMNFIGWREFERRYGTDFAQKAPTNRVASIEFILHNPNSSAMKIYLDRVDLEGTVGGNKFATDWCSPDAGLFTGEALLKEYALIADATLPYLQPSEDELQSLALIKSRNPITLRAGNIDAARKFVNDLNISRNEDGTIKADYKALRDCGLIETSSIIEVLTRIETLGYAAQTSAEDKQLLTDYLDYVFDQDYLFRTTAFAASDYTLVRNLGQSFVNAFKACESQRHQNAMLSLMQWVFAYGHMYRSDYLTSQNSDVIHNYIAYYLQIIANIDDATVAVRELNGFKRYLDRATEYTPGSSDLLKPDGSGFHHNTHYPNYMYAYRGWIDAWYTLRGTIFSPEIDGYERFKDAVMMMCKLATRGSSANFLANSQGGRNPFAAGIRLVLSKPYLTKLSAVGADLYGTDSDTELDDFAAYMFDAASSNNDFDGFYAFNWSPAGVYRHGNWVATMRAPTTKFWGAEIYSSRNRFGRYQSHGTLEVLYNHSTKPTGYPSSNSESGWDWNVVPGGTTVHYTSWQEMMPNKNTTQRFDQFTRTKNFSGALSMGDCGIFATDFDQIDTWSVTCFSPTELKFKKSVFAIDGKLISLGSNISSSSSPANTNITATNLYQSFKPLNQTFRNGEVLPQSQNNNVYTGNNWIITPENTGYYIPSGNDNLVMFFGEQSSPVDDASNINSPGSAIASKAYIDHGITPENKHYHFIVVPDADEAIMNQTANEVATDGGSLYTINAQNEQVHSITYHPMNMTAYAFFAAMEELSFGPLASVGSEMLLMHEAKNETELAFAVCNPDLRPQNVSVGWTSTPTYTFIRLKDKWILSSESNENIVVSNDENGTLVSLMLKDGMPVYFNLSKEDGSVGLTDETEINNSHIWVENKELHIISSSASVARVFNSSGLNIHTTVSSGRHLIPLTQGVYIVQLQTGNDMITEKIIVN